MNKSAYLIIGSCLVLQAVPQMLEATTAEPDDMPIYHMQHARELLSDANGAQANPQPVVSSAKIAGYVKSRTKELLPLKYQGQSRRVARALIKNANRQHMDPLFLMAVIKQESRFNPLAIGTHGEIGLMQLKPSTGSLDATA